MGGSGLAAGVGVALGPELEGTGPRSWGRCRAESWGVGARLGSRAGGTGLGPGEGALSLDLRGGAGPRSTGNGSAGNWGGRAGTWDAGPRAWGMAQPGTGGCRARMGWAPGRRAPLTECLLCGNIMSVAAGARAARPVCPGSPRRRLLRAPGGRACPGADRQLPGRRRRLPRPASRFLRPPPRAPRRAPGRFLRARRPLCPPAARLPARKPPLLLSNGGDAGSGRGLGCAEAPAPPAAAAAAATSASRAPCAPPRGRAQGGPRIPTHPPPRAGRRGDLGPGARPAARAAPAGAVCVRPPGPWFPHVSEPGALLPHRNLRRSHGATDACHGHAL